MLRAMVMIIAIACGVGSSAQSEVVEITLPDLLGIYPTLETMVTRTTTFGLPAIPVAIHGASIRISGTTSVGAVSCEWGGPFARAMDLSAWMKDVTPGQSWIAWELMPETSGPFGWTAEFDPTSSATWEFLMDGEAEINLSGVPTPLVGLCWPVSADPTATVTEAVLIIDAEFPVPVDATSWGRIKALNE